jgi:hypothetical protein
MEVRLSRLSEIAGVPQPRDGDKCFVLQGKPEITPQYAVEIIAASQT